MRLWLPGAALAFIVTGGMTVAFAAPYRLDPEPPLSGIYHTLYGIDLPGAGGLDQPLNDYLAGAKCGGWLGLNVGEQLGAGFISKTQGLPGWEGEPLGDIQSGLSERIDVGGPDNTGFLYPEMMQGLSTVCQPDHAATTPVNDWDPDRHEWVQRDVPYPVFRDPACLYGAAGGPIPPLSEQRCVEFCNWVNTFTYEACAETGMVVDPNGDPLPNGDPPLVEDCIRRATFYTCSGQEAAPAAGEEILRNCRVCTGEACRCPGPGCEPTPGGVYLSYYRRYDGNYHREALPATTDDAAGNVVAGCYGFYHQYDPRTTVAEDRDYRCSVQVQNLNQFPVTQQAKGEYGLTAAWPDPNPLDPAALADGGDLWAPFSGAFSLLKEEEFQDDHDGDLGSVYLDAGALDTARERATYQLDAGTPMAKGNLIEDFDDTEMGAVTRWWRRQQSIVASRLMRRPTVNLLLPPMWQLGMDVTQPPFRAAVAARDEDRDPRSEAIAVQIDAGEDLMGSVLRSLRLPVEEVPVRFPLPTASITELMAIKQSWCTRIIQERGTPHCDDPPAPVRTFFTQIDAYIQYAEDVRKLRGALAAHVGNVLEIQNQITEPIAEDLREYLEPYRDVLNQQRDIERRMLPAWNAARTAYQRFHDTTNRPWCMNARFTHAVYFLNDWMRGRANNGSMYAQQSNAALSLPTLEVIEPPKDITIDLSDIRIGQGKLTIPVFKPILVHLELPLPPPLGTAIAGANPVLPPAPSIAELLAAMDAAAAGLPAVQAPPAGPALVDMPEPLDDAALNRIEATLGNIRQTVADMDAAYAYFWNSLRAAAADPTIPARCPNWRQQPCLPEMELIAIVTRATSRPGVQLQEDYQDRGYPRGFPTTCLDRDPGCTVLPPEILPPHLIWETRMPPDDDTRITTLRERVRELTLPDPLGDASLPETDVVPMELQPVVAPSSAIPLIP